MVIRMDRVGDAGMINRHPVARGGVRIAQKIAANRARRPPTPRSVFKKSRRLILAFMSFAPSSVSSMLFPSLSRVSISAAAAWDRKYRASHRPSKIDAEHGDKNRQARKDRQPRRAVDVAPTFGKHRTPGRNMHRHAETEKTQARFGDDHDRHAESRDHRDAGEGIGNHMAKQHIEVSGRRALSPR